MIHLVNTDRIYPPETVAAMTAAFDRVCQSLSAQINGNEIVRKTLALIILRHVDLGEQDPMRLADVALRELAGKERSAIGDGGQKAWDSRARIGLQLRT
jgi:hypothetical protein